ncbi:MAG TPA: hypothetical protein PKC30_08565 [Saprospiraceae bacterium]|nr:hypothetical protein [Saprospiraceae bacterium]
MSLFYIKAFLTCCDVGLVQLDAPLLAFSEVPQCRTIKMVVMVRSHSRVGFTQKILGDHLSYWNDARVVVFQEPGLLFRIQNHIWLPDGPLYGISPMHTGRSGINFLYSVTSVDWSPPTYLTR